MNERMEDGMSGVWIGQATRKRKIKKGNRKDGSSTDLFINCMTERLTDSSTV